MVEITDFLTSSLYGTAKCVEFSVFMSFRWISKTAAIENSKLTMLNIWKFIENKFYSRSRIKNELQSYYSCTFTHAVELNNVLIVSINYVIMSCLFPYLYQVIKNIQMVLWLNNFGFSFLKIYMKYYHCIFKQYDSLTNNAFHNVVIKFEWI